MKKRRKKPVRDLNEEVANALGAATKTTVPKAEDLLGSEEAMRELENARSKGSLRKR